MTVQIKCVFLYFLQETFTPVYYLVLIIVMKMVIPNPTYPAITTPQGSSSVMNFPKLSSNSTQIGIAPNDEKTQTFIIETVLKSSILYVSWCIFHTAWIWIWMTKRPGVTSDGNFSSYLIRRSGYGWLFPFPVGGNGNNPIYPLLSTVLSTWTEPETCFG